MGLIFEGLFDSKVFSFCYQNNSIEEYCSISGPKVTVSPFKTQFWILQYSQHHNIFEVLGTVGWTSVSLSFSCVPLPGPPPRAILPLPLELAAHRSPSRLSSPARRSPLPLVLAACRSSGAAPWPAAPSRGLLRHNGELCRRNYLWRNSGARCNYLDAKATQFSTLWTH